MARLSAVRRVTAAVFAAALAQFSPAVTPHAGASPLDFFRACTVPGPPGKAACSVLVRSDVMQRTQAAAGPHAPTGSGYGPDALQNAYLLPSGTAGAGQTVAVVDAYDYPSAEVDLATYRSAWGLPPCTTANGCFRKVNQNGQPSPLPTASGSTGWATEAALDIDMVSAACPNCSILLVEANSAAVNDLGTGVNSAVALGAKFVSNSYGANEYPEEAADDAAAYDHPGVVLTASTGDAGYGVEFPASSPHVVAVGGTSLSTSQNARGWQETVWSGAGSGCSQLLAKPSWQTDAGCANRTSADVSAVADPKTGVAVYDTYDRSGWLEVGGTSVSAPLIASIYALAGPPAPSTYPASYLYAHSSDLNDVTTGANGTCDPAYLCTGQPGYDGPTGLGTPNGIAAFGVPAGDLVTIGNPGSQTATQDMPFHLQLHAVDTAPGQTLTYAADGLPPGLSIDAARGLITGTPTSVGSYPTTVTATDTTGTVGAVRFAIAVVSPVAFAGPGPQAGYVGEPVTANVVASDAVAGRTLHYTASTLPTGISVDAATGVLSGVLAAPGYVRAAVTATDSAGRSTEDTFIWYVAPAQVTGQTGPITLAGTGRCLGSNPLGVSTCHRSSWTMSADGTIRSQGDCLTAMDPAQLTACTGDPPQQWRIVSFAGLLNPASGMCLDAGTGLRLQSCTGGPTQRWVVPAGPAVSGVPGLCADTGAATEQVSVWYCGAQDWVVAADGTVRADKSCLDASGTTVSIAGCTGSTTQQWRINPDGTIVAAASGQCLADPGDSQIAGTRLVAADCRTATGQLWHIE